MSPRTIVVIGGAVAGPTAAARARETDEKARIILLERNRHVSYAACGLGLYLSREVRGMDALNAERADFFLGTYNIEVRTSVAVERIDASSHKLYLNTDKGSEELKYDSLVYALGAASRDVPGLDGELANVAQFRTLVDLEKIEASLKRGKKVAIIGSGPLGIEAAEAFIRAGCQVTILESDSTLFPAAGALLSGRLRQVLRGHCRTICEAKIAGFQTADSRVTSIELESGEAIHVDLVIAAIGITPRTQLLKAAGADLHENGTLVVDSNCKTSLTDVYACGVCVSVIHAVSGQPVWLPQGALADKTAQVAGANAAGGSVNLLPATGTMLLRALDETLGSTGLTPADARSAFGTDARVIGAVAPSTEKYLGDSHRLVVQLVYRLSNGRVLGVQASGRSGVDKRLDAVAVGIASGVTVEQLAGVDFGYTPTMNCARDPLNIVAQLAVQERAGECNGMEADAFLSEEPQTIDVSRDPGGNGHVRHLPLEELREKLPELKAPVVILSEDGRRGWLAQQILQSNDVDSRFVFGGRTAVQILKANQNRSDA